MKLYSMPATSEIVIIAKADKSSCQAGNDVPYEMVSTVLRGGGRTWGDYWQLVEPGRDDAASCNPSLLRRADPVCFETEMGFLREFSAHSSVCVSFLRQSARRL